MLGPFQFSARTTSLAGGLKLVEVPRSTLPLVHVAVVVQAGSELDPVEMPGLAALTARALDEGGAGTHGPREMGEVVDDLGAELHVKCLRSGVIFDLAVESSRLPGALAMLGDLVSRPRFDETELGAIRDRQIDDRKHELDDPHQMANDAMSRALYGPHPYGHPTLGTVRSIAAIRGADLRAFWSAHYGPRTTTVVIVGDAGGAALSSLVSTAFAGWKSEAAPPTVAPTTLVAPSRIILIDKPDAPQSEVRVGHRGESWSSRELTTLSMLEMLLGGTFTSRLVQNLREKHGYTYGVTAVWDLQRAGGTFHVGSAVRTDVTAAAIGEILKELRGSLAPIPVAELAKCRVMMQSQFITDWGTSKGTAMTLAQLAQNGQSVELLNRLVATSATLTPESLATRAQTLIRPSELVIVVVGDRQKIEASLKTLALPVELAQPVN